MPRFEDNERLAVFREGRSIFLFDDIDNYTVAECFKLFKLLEEEGKKPITLIINTSGGTIYDGLALYDRIKISPCKVITIGTGWVASMGLIIFLAGEERLITPNTVLLNHQNSTEVMGRTDDIKIEAKEITRLENLTAHLISQVTGQPLKKLKEEIKSGDKYITPAEALTMGYAHQMLEYYNHPKTDIKKKRK